MKDNRKSPGNSTRLVHGLYDPHQNHGFINPPVYRGSTVLFQDARSLVTEEQPYTYGTHGTPTTDALCHAVNTLEGAARTVLVPSGLAAVTTAMLGALQNGNHVLIVDSVYHPTRRFADTVLKKLGVHVEYYDPGIGENIRQLLRPETKVVFTESPGSNTFEVQDIPAICTEAHKAGALVMMDNTWATPLYFHPLRHGVDISIHAATKYFSGYSDILLGTISATEQYAGLIDNAHRLLGMATNGDDAYLALRGLRTMDVRMQHQQKTALKLARWLETRTEVAEVLYPPLESHAGHALWKRDFTGAASIFSIVLNSRSREQAYAFLNALELFGLGYSWGGVASLAVYVNLEDRTILRKNYAGPVLRLQVGVEDFDDLQADLASAFAAMG